MSAEKSYDNKQKKIATMEETATNIKLKKDELMHWWDLCKIGAKERDQFISASKINDESILKLYDLEIERLEKFYNSNQEIFKSVDKWKEMWEQYKNMFFCEFENSDELLDYDHLLLVTEKVEKFGTEDLLKAKEQLIEIVIEYEKTQGESFTIDGLSLSEYFIQQGEEFDIELKEFITAKKSVIKTMEDSKKPNSSIKEQIATMEKIESHKITREQLMHWKELWDQYNKIFFCEFENPEKLRDRDHLLFVREKLVKFDAELLSKVREQLEKMAIEYEKTQGESFTIDGLSLSDYFACQEKEYGKKIREFLTAKQKDLEEKTGTKLPFNMAQF